MRTFFSVLIASFCLIAIQRPVFAGTLCSSDPRNLVVNCGFETGDFTGWTVSGNDVPFELNNLYGVEGIDPLDGISPDSGNYQAYIADLDANSTTLSETLATTAGRGYYISFWLAQDTPTLLPYSNGLSVSFGGTTVGILTAVPVEGYTKYTFAGTASTSSTVLSLTLGNDLGQFLLDDVAVDPAPEPSTVFLLLTGLAVAGIFGAGRKFRVVRQPRPIVPVWEG